MTQTNTSSFTVSERLADWATNRRLEDVPGEVVVFAKRLVLDSLGLQVRASTLAHVQPQRRLIEAARANPEATIIGTGVRTTVGNAAFVNGTFAASMEFDDCNMLPWHAGSVVVPTSLAVAEQKGGSGADLLLGTIVGQQVMSLIGTVASAGFQEAGWHAARATGGFAAAASAAAILGLDAEVLVNAFGVAGGDASGPMEYDKAGGEVKRQYTGSAARSGIEALQLARYGLTGPRTIFEGHNGIFRIMAHRDDLGPLEAGWNTWHMLGTFFRLSPGVGTVLPALDIVSRLAAEKRFDWYEVEAIEVGLPQFALSHGAEIVVPTDSLGAHFSLAFALGLRLVTGGCATEDYFKPELWSDPRIVSIARKVHVSAYDFGTTQRVLAADVTIRLADGRSFHGNQHGFAGHPLAPATDDQLAGKFRANARGILAEAAVEQAITIIRGLENLSDVRTLVRLLSPA